MVKLTDVTGIGPVTAKLLSEHNIKTVEALASISLTELQKIPGFSDIRARAVKKAAADCLQGKVAKQLTTPANIPQTTVKQAASQKTTEPTVISQVSNQAEADKGKDKKKNKKDDKKKEKIKAKDKKQKGKNKDKNKKKDKKKS